MKKHWLLVFILVLGLSLRLFGITQTPPRLTVDEISIGFNANSIALTGTDEWGLRYPLVFKAFGDYKQPAYIYAAAVFIKLFGLSPLTVRLPSIIAGTLLILGVYWLCQLAFKNRSLSLLSAGVVAITPWAIKLSRFALESNLALCFFVFGLIYLIKTLRTHKLKSAIIAGILLALPFYTYIAFRLVIGLMLLYLGVVFIFQKKFRKTLFFVGLGGLIMLLPLTKNLFDASGQARLNQVGMFSDVGVKAEVDEKRSLCYLQDPKILDKVCHIVFNKYQVWLMRFSSNYLEFFSPGFLFVSGDKNINYNPPGWGEFLLIFAPFYLIGLYQLFKTKGFEANLIKAGLLLAPIPTALTGYPQIVRGSTLMPFIGILIGLGLWEFIKYCQKVKYGVWLKGALAIGILAMVGLYKLNYAFVYPIKYAYAFYNLDRSVADVLKQIEPNYDLIYFQQKFPEPHIFLAFYKQWDPVWYQTNVHRLPPDSYGFERPDKIGKYEFGEELISKFLCQDNNERVLYVTDQSVNYPTLPELTFYDFAKVHIQAKIFDIDWLRKELGDSICQN